MKVALFFLFTALIVGCSKQQQSSSVYVEPQCITEQSQCLLDSTFGKVSILFNVDQVTTEQEFQIIVTGETLSSNAKVSAYLEGKDMYMGKIPLFFQYDQQQQRFVSDVLLGSCTEQQMIWTMWLSLSEPGSSSSKSQKLFIDFISHR